MKNKSVSIIIVNWNGQKWLAGCLDAIFKQAYKNIEIIVVDNNSSDGSVSFISKNYPSVIVVENDRNEGFGRANNIGVAKANGDLIFFLNNDTLLESNVIKDLLQEKEIKKVNIIGPKILNFNCQDIYKGRKLSIDFLGYLGWGKETFYIEGCAFMIEKKDFLALGGFDEKYFMYSEDIDLCWRAWIFGMKIGICDYISIKHFGGGSAGPTQLVSRERHVVPIFRKYEVEKNNLRNLLKNYHWISLPWAMLFFLIQNFGEAIVYLLAGNSEASLVIGKAVWWNILNIDDTIRERRLIQGRRKIDDLAILCRVTFWPNKIQALRVAGLPRFK